MKPLSDVVRFLRLRDVPHALIGAGAMAVHGVSRSTFDLDLLLTDPAVLREPFWEPLRGTAASIDVRRGDADDPLAGVVRIEAAGERAVDLVVGRHGWQKRVIDRAEPAKVGDVDLPVVLVSDLVLLKLFAGGPQDAWDIESLLAAAEDRAALVASVEIEIDGLPSDAAEIWKRIVEV
jgi:hypothetical protein